MIEEARVRITPQGELQAQYDEAFRDECQYEYPALDELETDHNYRIARNRLEPYARVLACPVKNNRPSWQHGRMIYTLARHYIENWLQLRASKENLFFVDIGTAKGFSAIMMSVALWDSGLNHTRYRITSVDVVDPHARVRRNTIAEVDGLLTLEETLARADAQQYAHKVLFLKSTGEAYLKGNQSRDMERINFAFIDGKHAYAAVSAELDLLAARQRSGDVCLLDDVQIAGVLQALNEHRNAYEWRIVVAMPSNDDPVRPHGARSYAIARRR